MSSISDSVGYRSLLLQQGTHINTIKMGEIILIPIAAASNDVAILKPAQNLHVERFVIHLPNLSQRSFVDIDEVMVRTPRLFTF